MMPGHSWHKIGKFLSHYVGRVEQFTRLIIWNNMGFESIFPVRKILLFKRSRRPLCVVRFLRHHIDYIYRNNLNPTSRAPRTNCSHIKILGDLYLSYGTTLIILLFFIGMLEAYKICMALHEALNFQHTVFTG